MKHIRTEKKKQDVNGLRLIILCSEMFMIFAICILTLNMNSRKEAYKNTRAKVGHFFEPIDLYRSEKGRSSTKEVGKTDQDGEKIGLTIGRLRGQYSCFTKSAIMVKNVFIESRDTKLLIEEIERSYSDYYFELEVDRRVDKILLNSLLDSLKHHSKKQIELVVLNSENKRLTEVLPDDFEF